MATPHGQGEWTLDGYGAWPTQGNGRGVLVLHPWWGLNDTIRGVCNRLADAGFVAFAPDLYGGKVADTIEGAEALAGELESDSATAQAKVADAARMLEAQTGSETHGIAVVGFSLGAFYAIDLSLRHPELVASVVLFYGSGGGDFARSRARYVAHFAEHDPYEPQEHIDYVVDGLQRAGRPLTLYRYPGTGHWFFEPDRTDAYNAEAAALAWERTLAFLRQ